MGVQYEDAVKMFDQVDKPPSGVELMDMNLKMVRAMKTAPAPVVRILAREAVTTEEKAEFDGIDAKGREESDKKSTDMTDDKAMNEIWNKRGSGAFAETDQAGRQATEGEAKKVRKLVGMCLRECPANKQGMGFYHDKKMNICYKCKSDCQKCGQYEGECSTCGWGMYEEEASTETEVEDDDGNVVDVKVKTCKACHASCKRCSGPGESQCKGCSKGFQLRAGKCVAGGRCKSGEVQVDSADAECVEDDGTKCKECKACSDSKCHRCKDATAGKCMQCKKGYTRSNSGSCTKCSEGCLKCKDSSTCLMCDKMYYLLENSKNSNSSAKVMCVKRCPVFYKAVSMKSLSASDLNRFKADDGNADPTDEVKVNAGKRKEYFDAKLKFERGEMSRADMEAKKNAIGRRLLAGGWNAPAARAVPGGGPNGD
jgi:hypothetical protein